MDVELKPCPFCGGDPSTFTKGGDERVGYVDTYKISCDCGACISKIDDRGPTGWAFNMTHGLKGRAAKEKAIEAWNTRAPSGFQVDRECRREIEGRKDGA